MGGEDEREGGALLYFHLTEPLPIQGAGREFPSPMRFLQMARPRPGSWIDIEKPFWWDVPVWVASGGVDSIGLVPIDTWRRFCAQGDGSCFIGVDGRAFPRDFAVFVRYHFDFVRRLPARFPIPPPLTLEALATFIHDARGRYRLEWRA